MKKKIVRVTKRAENQEKDLKEQLARALADYDNLRKRVEAEKETFVTIANLKLVSRLLPVLDMLEQIQKHVQDSGLAIGLKEFKETLQDEGIEEIKAEVGEKFDQNLHQVVEAIETKEKGKNGQIAEVVLKGYKYTKADLVIRPTQVKVYKQKEK